MASAVYGMRAIPDRWIRRLGAFDSWIGALDRDAPRVLDPSIVELERRWTELLSCGKRK